MTVVSVVSVTGVRPGYRPNLLTFPSFSMFLHTFIFHVFRSFSMLFLAFAALLPMLLMLLKLLLMLLLLILLVQP